MASIPYRAGAFGEVAIKVASGAGTPDDPYVLAVAPASAGAAAGALEASEAHIGEVGGNLATVAIEVTRPADTNAYTAGDVVSNATSGSVLRTVANLLRVNAGTGYLVGARLITDKKSITPSFRVHLFNVSNPTFGHDNEAHQERYADIGKKIGSFDLPAMTTPADTSNSTLSQSLDMTLRVPIKAAAATRTIYALLEALDAFTPASGQKFTLELTVDNN